MFHLTTVIGRKEISNLVMHSIPIVYGYLALDIGKGPLRYRDTQIYILMISFTVVWCWT